MIDNHILNGDQNEEDDRSNDVVAAYNEVSKGLDDASGSCRSTIPIEQNEACRANVQCQAKKSKQQQCSREDVEFNRSEDVHRDHEHDDGHHNVYYD